MCLVGPVIGLPVSLPCKLARPGAPGACVWVLGLLTGVASTPQAYLLLPRWSSVDIHAADVSAARKTVRSGTGRSSAAREVRHVEQPRDQGEIGGRMQDYIKHLEQSTPVAELKQPRVGGTDTGPLMASLST